MQTSEHDISEERLVALIGGRVIELGPGFPPDADLYAAGLDSLAIMRLLLVLEEEFHVSIPAGSVSRKNFATVSAVAELVRQRLSGEEIIPPCMATATGPGAVAAPEAAEDKSSPRLRDQFEDGHGIV